MVRSSGMGKRGPPSGYISDIFDRDDAKVSEKRGWDAEEQVTGADRTDQAEALLIRDLR